MSSESIGTFVPPREVIAKGSKSFFLASLFFGREARVGAWDLYRWCRYCDDQIDEAGGAKEFEAKRAAAAQLLPQLEAFRRLQQLRNATGAAIAGAWVEGAIEPAFFGLGRLAQTYGLPPKYPFELLQGFELDARGEVYESFEDLLKYAYHVAGVVGVMMCYVMGVSHSRALRHAVALGNAMQITNIARDVAEDAQLGRIYLPRQWLREFQIEPREILSPTSADAIHAIRLRLLDRADDLYRLGYEGLPYLPLRAAAAVSIAGSIYSAIGRKIRTSKPEQLMERMHLPLWQKLYPVADGLLRVLPLAVRRLFRPWRPTALASGGF